MLTYGMRTCDVCNIRQTNTIGRCNVLSMFRTSRISRTRYHGSSHVVFVFKLHRISSCVVVARPPFVLLPTWKAARPFSFGVFFASWSSYLIKQCNVVVTDITRCFSFVVYSFPVKRITHSKRNRSLAITTTRPSIDRQSVVVVHNQTSWFCIWADTDRANASRFAAGSAVFFFVFLVRDFESQAHIFSISYNKNTNLLSLSRCDFDSKSAFPNKTSQTIFFCFLFSPCPWSFLVLVFFVSCLSSAFTLG